MLKCHGYYQILVCLLIFGMCIISVFVAQIKFSAIDRVYGKLTIFPNQSFGAYPHRKQETGNIYSSQRQQNRVFNTKKHTVYYIYVDTKKRTGKNIEYGLKIKDNVI